jgi:hypothetical protein
LSSGRLLKDFTGITFEMRIADVGIEKGFAGSAGITVITSMGI